MTALTVTAEGQVTFPKDILRHLGIPVGGRVRLAFRPDGRVQIEAAPLAGTWPELQGFLRGKTNGARLSIQGIEAVIAEAGGSTGTGRG